MGKYMIRPLLALERLCFLEKEGQVMVRYYGLYANAHRGYIKKTGSEFRFMPPHDGWMGSSRRNGARKQAQPNANFL